MTKVKIILPVSFIPDGMTVTKPTGSKKYTLRKKGIPLYTKEGKKVLLNDMPVMQAADALNAVSLTDDLAMQFTSLSDAAHTLNMINLEGK